tara:strand:+ start:107 stop:250 length:144 start_codon:yes stop_codon:yes gene_type:complete
MKKIFLKKFTDLVNNKEQLNYMKKNTTIQLNNMINKFNIQIEKIINE